MHISYSCVSNVLSCFQTWGSVFLATSLSKFQTPVTGGTNPVHHTIMLILFVTGLLSELWQHLFQFHVKFHTLTLILLLKRHEHIHPNFVSLNSTEFFPCGKADLTAFYNLILLMKPKAEARRQRYFLKNSYPKIQVYKQWHAHLMYLCQTPEPSKYYC